MASHVFEKASIMTFLADKKPVPVQYMDWKKTVFSAINENLVMAGGFSWMDWEVTPAIDDDYSEEEYIATAREELREMLEPINPSAYWIDPDECQVVAIEVEDNSRVTPGRLRDYGSLAGSLDMVAWELMVLILDRYGNLTKEFHGFYLPIFLAADGHQ